MCLGKYFPTPEVCKVPQVIKQHAVAQSNFIYYNYNDWSLIFL